MSEDRVVRGQPSRVGRGSRRGVVDVTEEDDGDDVAGRAAGRKGVGGGGGHNGTGDGIQRDCKTESSATVRYGGG